MKENIILIFKSLFVIYFFINGIIGLAKICELILNDKSICILWRHVLFANIFITACMVFLVMFIATIEYFNL
jgi:hypothetical protein